MANNSTMRQVVSAERHIVSDSTITEILQAYYGDLKSSVKRFCRDADCSDKTARNILTGKCLPSTPILFRLMHRNTEVARSIYHAMGYTADDLQQADNRLTAVEERLDALRREIAELKR